MPLLDIGPGELVDRMTILELKLDKARLSDDGDEKARAAERQLAAVKAALAKLRTPVPEDLVKQMRHINQTLWDTEDEMRTALGSAPVLEGGKCQDPDFATKCAQSHVCRLSRAIAHWNDDRCETKAAIDRAMGKRLVEFKVYKSSIYVDAGGVPTGPATGMPMHKKLPASAASSTVPDEGLVTRSGRVIARPVTPRT